MHIPNSTQYFVTVFFGILNEGFLCNNHQRHIVYFLTETGINFLERIEFNRVAVGLCLERITYQYLRHGELLFQTVVLVQFASLLGNQLKQERIQISSRRQVLQTDGVRFNTRITVCD